MVSFIRAVRLNRESPLEQKKWWHTCRLFGTSSLKEGAM
jgi:hypothetical protein